jgi:hypothetical protein
MPEQYESDAALLAVIGDVYGELDPVPPQVVQAGKASITWRTVDAELAEISLDSLLEGAAGVRSAVGPRLVSFEAPNLTVEVEIGETGETRRLIGQLVPPTPAEVVVRQPAGEQTVTADELGRFTVQNVPAGLVSLLVRVADATEQAVVTSWVTV